MTTANRRQVLDMLAEGKISADEAERLLGALGHRQSASSDIATKIEDGVEQATNMVASTIERVSLEIEDAIKRPGTEVDSRTFAVEGRPRIFVQNFNGRVEMDGGGPEDEVQVDAELMHPDRVDYSAVQDGDTIRIETRPAGRRSIFGWLPINRGAHIRITVPSSVELDVTNSNGRIIVRDVAGSGTLRTSNGRIVAERLTGQFSLSTSNSRIASDHLNGKFELTTSNGRIVASSMTGEYRMQTSNGQIRFDGELDPGSDNSFTTSNGAITAVLRGDPGLRLAANTSNGSIHCSRHLDTVGTRQKRRLEGESGNGETGLTLRTSNGSITLD